MSQMVIPIGPQHPALKEPISFMLTAEGERIAASPACRGLVTVSSRFGHDGFLIETDQVFAAIGDALEDRPVRGRIPVAAEEGHLPPTSEYRAEVRPAVPFSTPGRPVLNGTGLW